MAKILEKTNPGINDLKSRDAVDTIPCSDFHFCVHTHTGFKLYKAPSSGMNANVGMATRGYCRLQYSPMSLNTQMGEEVALNFLSFHNINSSS